MQLARALPPVVFLALAGVAVFVRARVPVPEHACPLGSDRGGWCESCGAGSLASLHIESKVLYDALDAHGHDVDPRSIECPTCRAALDADGYCEACKRGFVGGLAYLSRLSYQLARGRVLSLDSIECPTCRENARELGWCEACGRGLVGRVEITDRQAYTLVARDYRRVMQADEVAARCELCAAAMVTGGMCPRCRIDYAE